MRLSRARLVAVNVMLLSALLVLVLIPATGAAPAQPDRARGDYTMVSGRFQGGNTHALYLIDGANQELVALRWDIARNGLVPIGYRNLAADAKSVRGGR
ncbi:MAG: hypothetical protein AB7G11_02865 [Phycisphaerales bacterium]